MVIIDRIASFFFDLALLCGSAYNEVSGWITPFNYLATPFYYFANFFNGISLELISFGAWVQALWDKAATILSEWDIWNILATPIEWATDAWNWVVDAVSNVWQIVADWWLTVIDTVRGWIDVATQTWNDLLDNVRDTANSVKAAWDNFWTTILPSLIGVGEAESLIQSKLREWFPFYNSLALLWQDIEEFFADPLEWIYSKLEEFVERYW